MKKSERFEKQIQRIHELVESENSEITWDDHIPDPDNPIQSRQIDITIRRKNKLTIVECRIHKARQNVKWIEEMIGRRISLEANAAIAVSASGFTKGAINKAKKYGIILRDLHTLTDKEISNWGHNTKIWLTFYQFENTSITFKFKESARGKLSSNEILKTMTKHGRFYGLFESIAKEIDQVENQPKPCMLKVQFTQFDFNINGEIIEKISIETNFKQINQSLNIPSIVAYDAPEINTEERDIIQEYVDLGNFEITQSSDIVSVAVDLSAIKCPTNSMFRFIKFDFKRKVSMKYMELLSPPKMEMKLSKLDIIMAFGL